MVPFNSTGGERLDQYISQVGSINSRPSSNWSPVLEFHGYLGFIVLIVPYLPTFIHDLHDFSFCPHIYAGLVQKSRHSQGFETSTIM